MVGKRGKESGMGAGDYGAESDDLPQLLEECISPFAAASRIGLPKGRSEALGHLISTSFGAMRQVRGQLDELCDVFRPTIPFTIWFGTSFESKSPGQIKASWIILRNGSAQLAQLATNSGLFSLEG